MIFLVKNARIFPLKDKNDNTITNVFEKNIQVCRKTKKLQIDEGNQLCNRSRKSWLQDKEAKIYSAHTEGKLVVVKRFIRTLNNKTYKFMTTISENVQLKMR